MKRAISIALCILMVIGLFTVIPFGASAAESELAAAGAASGTTGRCRWSLDDNGTLTISGSGAMSDYRRSSSVPWLSYTIKEVIIEEGVTRIGNYAFYGCSQVTIVVIPDSVTSIGRYAFAQCTALDAVIIGNSVTSIESTAFSQCRALTDIIIPDSVTSISDSAFSQCAALESVTLGSSLRTIGNNAFKSCSALTVITIPDTVTGIGTGAFDSQIAIYGIEGTAAETYANNNRLAFIRYYEYEVQKDDSAIIIKYNGLDTKVYLPSSLVGHPVTAIGDGAFSNCTDLVSVMIPDYIVSIGKNLFYNCQDLETIIVEEGNPVYDSRDNCDAIIETASDALIAGCNFSAIPDSVTAIGDQAFAGFEGITRLDVPELVATIGDQAFSGCTNLAMIYFPNTVASIGEGAFANCASLTDVYYRGGQLSWNRIVIGDGNDCLLRADLHTAPSILAIGDGWTLDEDRILTVTKNILGASEQETTDYAEACAAYGCDKVVICGGVSEIGSYGLRGVGADAVELPPTLKTIQAHAFTGETYARLDIPEGVTDIADDAFLGADIAVLAIPHSVTYLDNNKSYQAHTTDIYYTGSETEWADLVGRTPDGVTVHYVALAASGSCGEGLGWALWGSQLCISGSGAMEDYAYDDAAAGYTYPWRTYGNLIRTIVIGPNVTAIGDSAFAELPATKLIIKSNSDTADPAGLSIGEQAFASCALTDVSLDRVTEIKTYAFRGNAFREITIPAGVTAIGDYAFDTSLEAHVCDIQLIKAPNCSEGHRYAIAYSVPFEAIDDSAHTYAVKSWNWSDDHTSATLTLKCANHDDDTHTTRAEVTSETVEVTCTVDGYTRYTATAEFNGETYTDVYTDTVTAPGHDLIDHEAKAATCTEIGWEAYHTCSRCDYSTYVEIPALGHDYAVVVTPPTCTAGGYTTHTCSRCGDTYITDEVDALGHDYTVVVTPPTCTAGGYTTHTCSRCGDTYITDEVDALGHDYGEWRTTKEATCTEDGEQKRTCSRCDAFETQVIEAPGHDYEVVVTPATCTAGGYTTHTCSRCGDTFITDEVDALGHDYGEWRTTKEATCTEDGEQKRICSRCDAFETQVLEAPGHDFVLTQISEEYYQLVCSHCGATDGEPEFHPVENGVSSDGYYRENGQIAPDKGLIEYNGDYYYVIYNGKIKRDGDRTVDADHNHTDLPNGTYHFGADGRMTNVPQPVEEPLNGIDSEGYYRENGEIVANAGLVEIDGFYYFVTYNGKIKKNGDRTVTAEAAHGLVPAGTYHFGADGRMTNPPSAEPENGIGSDGYYRENGEIVPDKGLVKIDGAYYYVLYNGKIKKDGDRTVDADHNTTHVPNGTYHFGPDGKMTDVPYIPPYIDEAGYYYEDDALCKDKGLVKIGDDYYYITYTGHYKVGERTVTAEKSNGLLPAGDYTFGEDGKMIDVPVLEGIGADGYYRENGVIMADAGLICIDGDYYYVIYNGKIKKNGDRTVTAEKANGLLPPGTYHFGADGKMTNVPEITEEPLDGIDSEGYYRENGDIVPDKGLVKIGDDYYYVVYNGKIKKNGLRTVTAEKSNGLLPPGDYYFGTDGKLVFDA